MSSIDKRALREAAERATESDWIVDAHEGWHAVIPVADAVNGNYIIAEFQGPESKRNRDFVAAANPATVLALLDELEAKDTQIIDSESRVRQQNRNVCEMFDENTALRKRIAELEASHAQVIHARDHYKRVASEGIQGIAESRTPTVKVPELSDEKFWIRFAGRLVFREETYRSAVINALDDAGIALDAGE
jgi:hypothetical protein